MRPARIRHQRRVAVSMTAYAAALFSVVWIFKHHPVSGAAAYLLAVLPALPIVGVVLIDALYLREETDEVEKAIRTQAMLWGIGLTLSIATMWGFLESFGQVHHVDSYMVFPIFYLISGFATRVIRWSYR